MNYPTMLATGTTDALGVADVLGEILGFGSDVLAMIQANPILLAYFAGGLLFVAVGLIKRLK